MTTIKSYSELRRFDTFDERFEYLKLNGQVGQSTFGFDRHINQRFYMSYEWKYAREQVILRDNGCDLGIPGYEINVEILIHHMNPMNVDDILHGEEWIFDPDFLITTTKNTHNAIHYGAENPYPRVVVARNPNDTKLW
jgi:hypothetical protein